MKLLITTDRTNQYREYDTNVAFELPDLEDAVKYYIKERNGIWDLTKILRIEVKGRDIYIYYVDIYGDEEYTVWSYRDLVTDFGEN